ncbi:MAG TPA: response regulator [Anaerolineae bacterium]|nr:response regulator [Anaerolineae bacterium]
MAEKILIVDDDVNALKLIGYTLHREGYEIIAARSGQEALVKAREEEPQLVILDIMMPRMDGYEVCRRLRATPQTAQVPVIMLTAKGQVEDKVAGFEAGADDYLTKPVIPAELVARVKALLLRSTYAALARAKSIAFIGAKGGVGVTTLAVNLAVTLAQMDKDVILLDLQPYSGAVALQLGISPVNTIADLLEKEPTALSQSVVEDTLIKHPSGIRILPAAQGPQSVRGEITLPHLEAIISNLETVARYLVLDMGFQLSPPTQQVLKKCNQVILVTEPDKIALTLAQRALDSLQVLDVKGSRIGIVVVNRTRSASTPTRSTIESTLGSELLSLFTPAPELFAQAAVEGTPVAWAQPTSLQAEMFRELAQRIA